MGGHAETKMIGKEGGHELHSEVKQEDKSPRQPLEGLPKRSTHSQALPDVAAAQEQGCRSVVALGADGSSWEELKERWEGRWLPKRLDSALLMGRDFTWLLSLSRRTLSIDLLACDLPARMKWNIF